MGGKLYIRFWRSLATRNSWQFRRKRTPFVGFCDIPPGQVFCQRRHSVRHVFIMNTIFTPKINELPVIWRSTIIIRFLAEAITDSPAGTTCLDCGSVMPKTGGTQLKRRFLAERNDNRFTLEPGQCGWVPRLGKQVQQLVVVDQFKLDAQARRFVRRDSS